MYNHMCNIWNHTILRRQHVDAFHVRLVTYLLLCVCGGLLSVVLSGCSLQNAVDVDDPEAGAVLDYTQVATRSSAIGLYQQAMGALRNAVNGKSEDVALFTDELTNSTAGQNRYWVQGDARQELYRKDGITKGLDHKGSSYNGLHSARVTANQARSILRRVNDVSLTALIAGTYAVEGYAIMMLAEDNCSGVPLTEVPFQGDIVYQEGLSTQQLFQVAVAKFDSALAITHDSASIVALARIGLGRAYLGLGDYTEAARAVADVTASDVFYVDFRADANDLPAWFWTGRSSGSSQVASQVEIVNQEGMNGMTWFSDPAHLDPRLPVTTTLVNGVRTFPSVVRQQKYLGGNFRFPLARGIEALMIRAEAALNGGDATWVRSLNDARATVGLSALTDPVAHEARVDMLFHERAFWFYLEGVRLADYRRLVRQYDRTPESVYPMGPYTRSANGEASFYGEAWVFLTPDAENQYNFRYHGCFNTQP